MSHQRQTLINFIPFTPEMSPTEHLCPADSGSTLAWSRISRYMSPTRTNSSSSQRSDSETPYDPFVCSTPSNMSVTDSPFGPFEDHTCSRCKLTDEEAKRLKAARRREQNRASQRRFRAKKDNAIRGAADQVATLESTVQDLQIRNIELGQSNLALKTRLAELENQRASDSIEGQASNTSAKCLYSNRELTDSTNNIIDFFWGLDDTDFDHSTNLETYLPKFDNESLPYDAW